MVEKNFKEVMKVEIVKVIQLEKLQELINHTNYALNQMKLIQEKITNNEELTIHERKFLEGYLN